MGFVEILLIILILAAFDGGNLGFGGAYRGPGNIVGLILTVLLVILIVRTLQGAGV